MMSQICGSCLKCVDGVSNRTDVTSSRTSVVSYWTDVELNRVDEVSNQRILMEFILNLKVWNQKFSLNS